MLSSLHSSFRVLASLPAASSEQVSLVKSQYPAMPFEYLNLVRQATEIELEHHSGKYIRIWAPSGCFDMDSGYDISNRIAGAIPIGDDGGGRGSFTWTDAGALDCTTSDLAT